MVNQVSIKPMHLHQTSMEFYASPILLLLFSCTIFFHFSSSATSVDTVSAHQEIKDGNTIISHGGIYELGFFSPRNSKNRYLGIWYKNISTFTVVWVANRDTPIQDTSGVFKVTKEGALQIHSSSNSIIWSSNTIVSSGNVKPVAQLLDNGNLIVWDETETESSTKENLIWQSFDHLGNTLLPGQNFGVNLITGRERYLTSWKSADDPSIGVYEQRLNANGYPQIFQLEGGAKRSRIGAWNGLGFRGLPIENTNPVYTVDFVVNKKEIYYQFDLKSSVLQRLVLNWDGIVMLLNWIERSQEWVVYGNIVVNRCSSYGTCGPYGSCSIKSHPLCTCLEGFEPRFLDEWNAGDWSSGCQRKKALDCGSEDGFLKVSGLNFPDTQRAWFNVSMTLEECERTCIRNCSCTAYANLDVRNRGSGCLLWFDELMDIYEYDDSQDLYIRMAASGIAGQSNFTKKNKVLTMALSVPTAALLLSATAYACRKKKKMPHKKRHDTPDKDHTGVHVENLDELPHFSFNEIVKATDNFNIDNKIGEGGFGMVYKGVLKDGQIIAIKRLSKTSHQGQEEFKNEILCVAKLQHRNLVKLLGYCIHGNEKILIYEYLDNKSLETFLFDETKSSMLDWHQRFRIIHGMARGILYLHQDSRLQIIHRDLKAANILLDGEMNPKISDFGLARKFVGHEDIAKTKHVAGTYGYISPEYAVHGRFSVKSDVFSFGVIVLEIVSGKKNRGFSHEGHSDNLLGHAWRLYKEDKSIELICRSLRNSCVVSEVLRAIHVGLLCVQHHAEDRPTMLSTVLMLISKSTLPPPKQPAFFTEESYHERQSISSVNDYMITVIGAR